MRCTPHTRSEAFGSLEAYGGDVQQVTCSPCTLDAGRGLGVVGDLGRVGDAVPAGHRGDEGLLDPLQVGYIHRGCHHGRRWAAGLPDPAGRLGSQG